MIPLVVPLAHSEPIGLDLSLPPQVASRPLVLSPPEPQALLGQALLASLAAGLGKVASPYAITGPTQSALTLAGWQCLGRDNSTLDVAYRCPHVGLTQRGAR